MKITYTLLSLILLLSSCWPCKDPFIIDRGKIPDSLLSKVPYVDGVTYKFQHSGGSVINYRAKRESNDLYWDDCPDEICCDILYKYENNDTRLRTEYPTYDFRITISNLPMDSTYYFRVGVGSFSVEIPLYPEQPYDYEYADSLKLGEQWYDEVYIFKNDISSTSTSLYPDSLYYNFTSGILKMVMSNGEYYQIYE